MIVIETNNKQWSEAVRNLSHSMGEDVKKLANAEWDGIEGFIAATKRIGEAGKELEALSNTLSVSIKRADGLIEL